MLKSSKKYLPWIPLCLLGIFYFYSLPYYIQGGDTAELVGASFHRFIPHPPGYPLFLWLQFTWTHLVQISSVYWNAALLSSIFSLMTLFILLSSQKNKGLIWFLPLILVGLNSEFLESTLLPDVFSLHALLVSIIGFLFLFNQDQKNNWLIPFFVMLSFANHHTSLFIVPCLFVYFHKETWKGYILGIICTVSLYLSLLLCRPEHPLSWGNVTNLENLLRHILRVDYGTFKLSASSQSSGSPAFLFLLKSLWPNLLVALVTFSLVFQKDKSILKDKKFVIWSLCLILSFLFPFMMNINPVNVGEEILRRFHIMPLIILSLWIFYLLPKLAISSRALLVLMIAMVPVTIINISNVPDVLNLRRDSTIQDYAENLLKEAKKNSPAMVLTNNDSSYFGLRYLQSFEPDQSKVAIVSLPLFFHSWYYHKINKQLPEFHMNNSESIVQTKYLNIENQILQPNLNKVNFITTDGYKDRDDLKVTFLSLGRMIQAGSGIHFQSNDLLIRFTPPIEDSGPQHFTKSFLFYQYSHYYMAKAYQYLNQDQENEAILNWEQAINIVPYAAPAMRNLCMRKPSSYPFCSSDILNSMTIKTNSFFKP